MPWPLAVVLLWQRFSWLRLGLRLRRSAHQRRTLRSRAHGGHTGATRSEELLSGLAWPIGFAPRTSMRKWGSALLGCAEGRWERPSHSSATFSLSIRAAPTPGRDELVSGFAWEIQPQQWLPAGEPSCWRQTTRTSGHFSINFTRTGSAPPYRAGDVQPHFSSSHELVSKGLKSPPAQVGNHST